MRYTAATAALALCLIAVSPATAIDWPAPGGRMLDVRTAGYVISVPAPDWIGKAVYDETHAFEANLVARWRVPVGLDLIAEQMVASVSVGDHWDVWLIGHINDAFLDTCSRNAVRELDLAPNTPTYTLSYALCGYDYSTGSGAMLIGISREIGPGVLLDLWYEVPMRPYDVYDEAAWPMSKANLEATLRALEATITVAAE